MNELLNAVKIILFSFILAFSLPIKAQTVSDSIDTFIKEKMERLKIPGLQLSVVKNGKLEKSGSYGFANLEHQVTTNSKTTFSINSMTKAFVGVAIMQLQERGKLSVKDPISLYISDIPNEWKSIKIEQLLSNSNLSYHTTRTTTKAGVSTRQDISKYSYDALRSICSVFPDYPQKIKTMYAMDAVNSIVASYTLVEDMVKTLKDEKAKQIFEEKIKTFYDLQLA